jgi:hypothetical protein
MGKGTIGINPFYHDGTIMSHGAMAGLLSVIISFTDAKSCEFRFFLPSTSSLLSSYAFRPLPASDFGLRPLASGSLQVEWTRIGEIGSLGIAWMLVSYLLHRSLLGSRTLPFLPLPSLRLTSPFYPSSLP